MANWSQRLTILYFWPPFGSKFGHYWNFRASTTYICLATRIFGIFSFVKPFILSIYGFTVFRMANLPEHLRFCILDLHFAQNMGHFATSRASTIYICLAKCIFGIVLFVQPFFLSIYGFAVFQMANMPQNWRFCILDLYFTQNFDIFATFRASTTYLCLAKYSFGIVSFVKPFFVSIYGFTVF